MAGIGGSGLSAGGGGADLTAFGDFNYDADNLLLPAGADWLFTVAPGGPAADTNNAGLRVLRLDDAAFDEGFGWQHIIPDGATQFTIDVVHRAEVASGITRQVGTQLGVRQLPDNALQQTPFQQFDTGDFDVPANEFFQYDQISLTLAFFALTAGLLTQWQIGRDAPAGSNQPGDWTVAAIRHRYS